MNDLERQLEILYTIRELINLKKERHEGDFSESSSPLLYSKHKYRHQTPVQLTPIKRQWKSTSLEENLGQSLEILTSW